VIARRRLALAGALTLGGFGALAVSAIADRVSPPRAASERPPLLLLTSLPVMFGEHFGLDSGGSPALTRLQQRYQVRPIGVADAPSLGQGGLLLMAQPRAQPAEALVELDQWVRGGGHVLLLADPRLDWPSERPLGDLLRPPPMFADTGLLGHWGLTLAGPDSGQPGAPGMLRSRGGCEVEDQGQVAHCRLGRGRATIIADADFINAEEPDSDGLDRLITELGRLETR
jgi:hypothetical protein